MTLKSRTTENEQSILGEIIKDILDQEAELNEVHMRLLTENIKPLRAGIKKLIEQYSTPQHRAREEVRPTLTYPSDYTGPKPLEEQIEILSKLWELNPDHALSYARLVYPNPTTPLPEWVEGPFAIVRWQATAPTYIEALKKLFTVIASTRPLYNYSEVWIDRFQEHEPNNTRLMEKFCATQKGDILIVPGQFGKRLAGKSPRRARILLDTNKVGDEMAFGAFAVGNMLLTHPERITSEEHLRLDCIGDAVVPGTKGGVPRVPFWSFRNDALRFDIHFEDQARGKFGAPTGFVPHKATSK